MDMNFAVFQEPRGVMRVLQFLFSIFAFATTVNYSGFVDINCGSPFKFLFDYPFNLELNMHELNLGLSDIKCHPKVSILADFSSDARFFVATGVIAMLYCLVICVIYTKFDQMYKSNNQIPLIDFLLSVFIAVLWLSSSASWANGLNGLKYTTENVQYDNMGAPGTCNCSSSTSSFNSLNISVILGFLNFFLWAADLWFLYKETTWFQNARVNNPEEN